MANPVRKVISIITPVYNEQDSVVECYEAVKAVFDSQLPNYDFEQIFADNCSSDNTPQVLRELAARDRRVKVILNARNFGIACSTFNALLTATGDAAVALFPVDLQDPPEVIPEMVRKWEQGFEVVHGVRKKREEGFILAGIRRAYYRLARRLGNVSLPLNVGDFQLIDRVVVEALRRFDDYYPYIRGMIASCGFRTAGVEYTWKARRHGISKNRLYHLIDQGLNGIISFSNLPMRLCMFAGVFLAAGSILYAFVSLALSIIYLAVYGHPVAIAGIPTLITALFFFSGVQLFFLGVIGEYVCAIHSQVRKRPLVIERERINF